MIGNLLWDLKEKNVAFLMKGLDVAGTTPLLTPAPFCLCEHESDAYGCGGQLVTMR